MSSNVYLVKVIAIDIKQSKSDQNESLNYKRVQVVQEIGYWMNKFSFNMFPNHHPYDSLEIGDKLFLRVSTVSYLHFYLCFCLCFQQNLCIKY